jgi:hypothetical protein
LGLGRVDEKIEPDAGVVDWAKKLGAAGLEGPASRAGAGFGAVSKKLGLLKSGAGDLGSVGSSPFAKKSNLGGGGAAGVVERAGAADGKRSGVAFGAGVAGMAGTAGTVGTGSIGLGCSFWDGWKAGADGFNVLALALKSKAGAGEGAPPFACLPNALPLEKALVGGPKALTEGVGLGCPKALDPGPKAETELDPGPKAETELVLDCVSALCSVFPVPKALADVLGAVGL